jgi:hypothetical protein
VKAALEVVEYTPDLVPLVREFNARLRAGGSGLKFAESPESDEFPRGGGSPIYEEFLLGLQGGTVRGGYVLKHRGARVRGTQRDLPLIRYPLSEGIVNPKHALVAFGMLKAATDRHPEIVAIGMGGLHQSLPKVLKAAGWRLWQVPFSFRVVHASAFLKGIVALRRSLWKRLLLDLAAISGLGYVVIRLMQWRSTASTGYHAELCEAFGAWADRIWERAAPAYELIAARDGESLRVLYPESDPRFLRLKVSKGGEPIGWAIVLDNQMKNHDYFGNLRVGTIADCCSTPEHASAVIGVCLDFLQRRGADLIISNQQHIAWRGALAANGFILGPSNYILGCSSALAAQLGPCIDEVHLNRGDGDGPVNI